MDGQHEEGGVSFRVTKHGALVAREKETPPMLKVVEETVVGEEAIGRETLDEIARLGAQTMLMRALVEESGCYVEVYEDERDGQGRRLAYRCSEGIRPQDSIRILGDSLVLPRRPARCHQAPRR